jgi:hypothetical protein
MFQMGDIPSGSTLVITDTSDVDIRCGFANRAYYPDGSLLSCHVGMDDSVIAGSGSKNYRAKSRSSSSYDDTDPATNITTLLAGHDLKVELTTIVAHYEYLVTINTGATTAYFPGFFKTGYTITNVHDEGNNVDWTNPTNYTVTNGSSTTFQGQSGFDGITLNLATPAPSGLYIKVTATWTHMSGSGLWKFTDTDVSGRWRKVIANPVLERWMSWAYFKDGATGTGTTDTHLKFYSYITRWRNSDGTQKAVYATAVAALEEIAVANKTRLDYTATWKNGGSTYDTYSSVQHPYRSQWATVRTENDANHARARCIAGSESWLVTSYDKTYMALVEAFNPYDPNLVVNNVSLTSANSTYTPCSNQAHRAAIDATGDYMGRGLMPQTDVTAWMSPTANHCRIARVNGLVGLHVPYHYRQVYGNTSPAVLLPLRMDNDLGTESATRWNADGLPNSIYLSSDSRPSTDNNSAGYVQPSGYDGVWVPSGDTSHGVAYSGYQWFVEGEEYLNQANLDLMNNTSIQRVGDVYGNRQALLWSGVGGGYAGFSGLGIPTAQWSAAACMAVGQQERATGFAIMIQTWAAAFHPAGRPESNYVQAFMAHQARFLERAIDYAPASLLSNGIWYIRDELSSPWQQAFNLQGAARAARIFGYQGHIDLATMLSKYVAGACTGNRLKTNSYHGASTTKAIPYHPSTNDFIADPADNLQCVDVSYDLATNVFTWTTFDDGMKATAVRNAYIQNDNPLYWSSTLNDGFGGTSVPPGLTEGTVYYVINRANSGLASITFQISLTQGGGAVDMTGSSGTGGACALMRLLGADNGSCPANGGYPEIHYAALVCGYEFGSAAINSTLVDSMETYISNLGFGPGNPVWSAKRTH